MKTETHTTEAQIYISSRTMKLKARSILSTTSISTSSISTTMFSSLLAARRTILAVMLGGIFIISPILSRASSPLAGQQPARPQQAEPPANREDASKSATGRNETVASGVVVASHEDYKIGPSDVLEIKVVDAPELSGSFIVSSGGFIPMPFLGDIKVKQKTPQELARLIADGLRGEYLKEPRVSVNVTQYNSRSFFIQGMVRSPGVYQIRGRASLLKLITIAGGLADNHGSTAFIIREVIAQQNSTEEGEKYELKQVNINTLLKGSFEQNVLIEPGDIINIPAADVFFVAGEVRKPGSFPLKDGTTLRQAISLAQGTTFEAARDRTVIFREDEKGKRQDIKVDLAAVMSGKNEDLTIKANDIVIIPNSRMKAVGGALLRAFGMATVQRGVPVPF